MLEKVFESLYPKVFINIVQKQSTILVYVETEHKGRVVENSEKEFETLKPNDTFFGYIESFTADTPYYFITLLDSSEVQGALPTCAKEKFDLFTDLSLSEYKCYHNRWLYYTAKADIDAQKKKYSVVGVDYIFSPFVILAKFFHDKINKDLALFVLVMDNALAIAVFQEGELLFGEHLDLQTPEDAEDLLLEDEISVDDDMELESDGIDLETLDVDDDETLEEFGNIEDLDDLEDIDEFAEDKDIEEELLESDMQLDESKDENFREDYQRFSLIQTAVARYYKDEKYESEFIENVYIADTIGVSAEFKRYLEEEMFFNVYIRKADLAVELCELAKEEQRS